MRIATRRDFVTYPDSRLGTVVKIMDAASMELLQVVLLIC